ncbi:MAG: hypothetical protein Fur0042_01570 [Cyanophyceae cyanobacterium]
MLLSDEYTLRREQSIRDAVDINALSFDEVNRLSLGSFPKSFDFIKLDVEGAEVEILKGMQTIIPDASFIQFEYASTWFHGDYKFMDVIETLNQQSLFYIYIILQDRLLKIYPEMMQQYFFANILATKFDFGEEQMFSQEKLSSRLGHHAPVENLTIF